MKLNLDPDALTFGDLEDYENLTGVPLMSIFGEDKEGNPLERLPAKQVVALVWICGRSENPDFTYEDARKVPITSIEVDDTKKEPDPTEGSGSNENAS